MEDEIVKKIGILNGFIKKLTDNQVSSNNSISYEQAYIFNAFYYLSNTLTYDKESEKAVKSIADQAKRTELYKKLLSLKKCILDGIGVCKQFSSYLSLLLANNSCILAGRGNIKVSQLQCQVKKANGSLDPHSLNLLTISGKDYFCDVSMGVTKRSAQLKFLLATERQIQEAFKTYDHSILSGVGDKIEIKPNSISNLYEMLEKGRFVVNKNTDTYTTSKYIFK